MSNESKIQVAQPRTGLRLGRVGLTRVTKGGGQFRRGHKERLDLRHESVRGGKDRMDPGGLVKRDDAELAQPNVLEVILADPHPFKVWRVYGQAKVIVQAGSVMWFTGIADPLVNKELSIGQSAQINVANGDKIWMKLSVSLTQESKSSETGGLDSGYTHHVRRYRVDVVAFDLFAALANDPTTPAAAPPPQPEDDLFTTFNVWVLLAKVAVIGGQAFVTKQLLEGNYWLTEFDEVKLDATFVQP